MARRAPLLLERIQAVNLIFARAYAKDGTTAEAVHEWVPSTYLEDSGKGADTAKL
jgi:hypothetical protein